MTIRLYDASNLEKINELSDDYARYVKDYFTPLIKEGVKKYINNVSAELAILDIDGILIPIAISEEDENSYVCSLYSHYISYAIEELALIENKLLKSLLKFTIEILGRFLKFSQVNKTIFVNNWLLSTNLYTPLSKIQIRKITQFLTQKFPDYFIVFRSVNDRIYPNIHKSLLENGYKSIASRQVYISKNLEEMKSIERQHIKRDFSLIKKKGYEVGYVTEGYDTLRLLELYNDLYITKYSDYNPKFTKDYFDYCLKHNLITFKYVKKQENLVGCLGYWCIDKIMTTPIFGYDISLGKKSGVYRILSALLVNEAEEKGYILHQSSGASGFKINRGAEPVIEYSSIYFNHLKFSRRIGIIILEKIINDIGIPLLKDKQL